MNKLNGFLIYLLLFLFILRGNAQKEIFRPGVILGVNIASLPNDDNDFKGLNTGIFCNADVNKHYNVKMELLFSQNGEYILPAYYPNSNYGKIRLNHVEVPLHIDIYVNSFERAKFLPVWALEVGFAYVNLINYYAEEINRNVLTDQIIYNYTDTFLFQFGTTVFINKHFAYGVRFSKPLKNTILELTGALRLTYML